ncbi:MAG: PHP domain-containing protein [Victivallales bacterium]|nr:PHP domain-containing protein [Victivallales bacterium]
MSQSFDFHLHSQWSYDALMPVEEYFRLARAKRLRAFALTDHHTMDGYGDVMECARKYPDVHFVAGAELTVHCPLGTYDLVCLNMPCREDGELVKLFQAYRAWQVAYGTAFSANMLRLGFPFDDQERLKLLRSYRPARVIEKQGNTHVRFATIRDYCIDRGFCHDQSEYLKMVGRFEDMPDYPEYDFVVPIVKRAGGIVLIAHPYDYFRHDDQKRMDELCEMLDLDGIECSNGGAVPEPFSRIYREYCRKHHLLSSAGTDGHDQRDGDQMARHFGEDSWLDELLERVKLH